MSFTNVHSWLQLNVIIAESEKPARFSRGRWVNLADGGSFEDGGTVFYSNSTTGSSHEVMAGLLLLHLLLLTC